ncbi:MAG TPA: SDR family NAD(P)-dependent oxidoreductase [Methylomusa anaerophila]|uniref:Putative oxidoreductase n=1 Tax=Methylomusa anaerophila TaxID=1930071 RepID=A0A348AGL3_9FIRM|nr:SDR family NAD(P)-dependent oxidoreductase [Methylomusa anaerophila]BBB90211.1 putative oxidoreductase [Methylomusa anaerophila]HML90735.1 SDR family NAD(P)-dependent oxidoreductase [Methylomusa anaerophila]
MKLSGNTILITGGGSGIGLAFAERFIKGGNQVIICGRRKDVLQKAQETLPGIITYPCDLTRESERSALFDWVTVNYPEVNVLVNNAGVSQRFNVLKADAKNNWGYFSKEITANLEAPIHLSMLFAPFFAEKKEAAIINVTSGLAFTPLAITPIYSATKAALHSFTVSLRYQLSATAIEVIEVAPPAVKTDLNGTWQNLHMEPLEAFANGIFKELEGGKTEIGYGNSVERMRMSRDEIDAFTEKMYNAMKASIK